LRITQRCILANFAVMDFEGYLISKKIDSKLFADAEPDLWRQWQSEFEQVHPNSFTAQKLYLINPLRRKYLLDTKEIKEIIETKVSAAPPETASSPQSSAAPLSSKPAVPRPVFKPKPKIS